MKQAAAQDKRKATIPPSPFLSSLLAIPSWSPHHLFYLSCIFLLTFQPTPQTCTSTTTTPYNHNRHTHTHIHSQGTAFWQTNSVCIYWVGHLWSCQLIHLKVCPLTAYHYSEYSTSFLLFYRSFYAHVFTAVCRYNWCKNGKNVQIYILNLPIWNKYIP